MTPPVLDPEREDYVSRGPYALQAHGISLQSRGASADGGRGDINIMAHGSGPAAGDGVVNIRAAREVLLDSGSARLALVKGATNSVALQNADPGSIAFVQGNTPASPRVELSGGAAPGVSLALGLPMAGPSIDLKPDGLALRYGPASAVELDAAGVRLSFGMWTVKLEAAGIELAAGATKLTLGPQGLTINGLTVDLSATTQLAMKGLKVDVAAQAILQAGGVITKVG